MQLPFASIALGALLLGVAVTPAMAESIAVRCTNGKDEPSTYDIGPKTIFSNGTREWLADNISISPSSVSWTISYSAYGSVAASSYRFSLDRITGEMEVDGWSDATKKHSIEKLKCERPKI